MRQDGTQERMTNSNSEIFVSSTVRGSSYVLGYRQISGHKLSIIISTPVTRSDRRNIQKGRRLIL